MQNFIGNKIFHCTHLWFLSVTNTLHFCQFQTLQRDRAVKLIKEHDQSQPFYLYLPFAAVHSPIQAPQEFIDLYDKSIPEPRRTFLGMLLLFSAIHYIYV